jgi:DNA-binding transcriptional ArsR family regulator
MNGQMTVNVPQMLDTVAIQNLDALRALVDGQRHRIVTLLIDEPLTAKDLAERLGIGRTRLYYHLALLERRGLIRVVDTRIVSGVQERTYRAVARTFRVDRALLASQVSEAEVFEAQAAILDAVAADVRARAVPSGASPDDDVFVSRTFVRLSDARRRELESRLKALVAEYRHGDADGIETELAVALFTSRSAQ